MLSVSLSNLIEIQKKLQQQAAEINSLAKSFSKSLFRGVPASVFQAKTHEKLFIRYLSDIQQSLS
jgi:hypothetical protein